MISDLAETERNPVDPGRSTVWRSLALSLTDQARLGEEISAFAAMTSAECYGVYVAVGRANDLPESFFAPIPWGWKGPICRGIAWLRKPALASLAAR